MSDRARPKVVVRALSQFFSSRGGVRPSLIVIHSTESTNVKGPGDLAAIGAWFRNPAAQVSAHVCTDADGNSARYVRDSDKAWHCAAYNRVSLGIEQIGRASQTSWTDAEIRETARWVARWSKLHGIPIRTGKVSGGSVVRSGVLRHSDLGSGGGNHNDPGSSYPIKRVLSLAKAYRKRI